MTDTARAMILAAGLGTRLRPLSDELPKPLIPVGDRPMILHIAGFLARAGFARVVINTHHHAEQFASLVSGLGVKAHLVHEPSILGTAGGIAGARALLGPPPIVAWNGDILASPPLGELGARAGSGLAFAVRKARPGEGTVGLDREGRVVRLRGETFGVEAEGGEYIGVAALGAAVLAGLPTEGCLIADVALPMLRRGDAVHSVVTSAPFTDIGSVDQYLAANLRWLELEAGPGGSWVHPTAEVSARVTLRASIVGEGARVEGKGVVEHSVIWPGARAMAPLERAIVTTRGVKVQAP